MREKKERKGKRKEKGEKESEEGKEAKHKETQEDRIHQSVLKERKPGDRFLEKVKVRFTIPGERI